MHIGARGRGESNSRTDFYTLQEFCGWKKVFFPVSSRNLTGDRVNAHADLKALPALIPQAGGGRR